MNTDAQAKKTAADLYRALVDEFVTGAGASDSKMFGVPTLKIGGKAFATFWEDGVVFKLPADDLKRALAIPGAHLFDPGGMGRTMKEWAVVPASHAGEWSALAWAALGYVTTLMATGAPKSKSMSSGRSGKGPRRVTTT